MLIISLFAGKWEKSGNARSERMIINVRISVLAERENEYWVDRKFLEDCMGFFPLHV